MTFDIDDIADHLKADGDEREVAGYEGGIWTFRLAIKPDDVSYEDIEDPEVFGRVAWIDHNRTGPIFRPSDFTGAARKLTVESYPGGQFWYEPPTWAQRFKGSGFETEAQWGAACDAHRDHVRSIISWGYSYVMITAEHRLPDGYHRTWASSLGGFESEHDPEYLASIVHDVLDELITEIT